MRRHKTVIIGIVCALGAFFLLYCAKQGHGLTPLVNGYCYFFVDRRGIAIGLDTRRDEARERLKRKTEHGEHSPSVANVDGYRVYNRIITGHVNGNNGFNPRDNQYHSDRPGYFIIDVKMDRVLNGLTKREWLKKLRRYGVKFEPELFEPSIFDKLLGRNKPAE